MNDKNLELLAPSGSYEAFEAAVQNGADAIYLGGDKFNARENATNFSNQEVEAAVLYAHARNVKIYVTLNILFYEDEVALVLEYIDFLYHIQVDALIMQDVGLIKLVKSVYPDFEIHASTQSNITSLETVKFFEKLGVSRVILARENTLEEIAYITKHTRLEIEVFIHGALCVGYSGQCLMSSMIGKRSGNRGQCAQPCRMPYRLLKEDQVLDKDSSFLLSTKDLNTIDILPQLIEAGVTSFKIEGRMKRPEYVACVVMSYKKVMQNYLNNATKVLPVATIKKELAEIFNRDFTRGYLQERSIVDTVLPGNRGVKIGEVKEYSFTKKRATILLYDRLSQYDGIRFGTNKDGFKVHRIYKDAKLVNQANANDCISIDYQERLPVGTVLYKTANRELLHRMKESYQQESKKIDITMHLHGLINQPLVLTIHDGNQQVSISSSEVITLAKTTPLDIERIKKQLSKTNDTCFIVSSILVDFPANGFFSIKALNQLRRDGIDRLYHQRAYKKIHYSDKKTDRIALPIPNVYQEKNYLNNSKQIYVSVVSLEQLKTVKKYSVDYVFYPFDQSISEAREELKNTSISLIPILPRVMNQNDFSKLVNNPSFLLFDTYLVNDYGSYQFLRSKGINCILNQNLNLLNSYSISLFNHQKIILSAELSKQQIKELTNDSNQLILKLYGYQEDMVMKHCPISFHFFTTKKEDCNKCRTAQFYLQDYIGNKYPIIPHENCCTSILHYAPTYIDDISSLSITSYLLAFSIENEETIDKIMCDFENIIFSHQASQIKKRYSNRKEYY